MSGFLSYDLAKAFAFSRNDSLNFAYLKENAELLCIARAQRFLLEPRARELYASFYNKASLLVGLYPQYYRFLLGIVLDLEDLGMPGNVGEEICQYIRSKNLLAFDTSDIRRLEAVHLLGRGADLTEKEIVIKKSLENRLENFTFSTEWFFKFNRPLFYDLTHLVFFLTDYGRKPLIGFNNLKNCLHSVGVLSLMDNDIDLLSETVICLKFIGEHIPEFWKKTLLEKKPTIDISFEQTFSSSLNSAVDDYHVYFTLNWGLLNLNAPAFTEKFNSRTPSFKYLEQKVSLLSKLSAFTHNKAMQKSTYLQTTEAFMGSINPEELKELNSIMASSHISVECLNGFASEALELAA